jgi:pyruvate kinase
MKRTKIICTIGPASDKPAILSAMIRSGMNIARQNFSHGTHQSHAKMTKLIRAAAKKAGEPVAILGDLQGPKIRMGNLPDAGVVLKSNATVTLPVTYRDLYKDVKKGDRILIDDGLIEARYVSGSPGEVSIKIVNGGTVTSHKGMNFPDSTLRISSLTKKDREDVVFGVRQGVDWIALSFVTSPDDVRLLRRLIKNAGKRGQVLPKIIVKIEKHEALKRFDEILAETDAVMVARGDLAVETPAEDVPIRQKEIIEKCRAAGKPVVVATQMLDSMIRNPRPTRAEVSDVANAVCDHADAVMLSGESATGKYPREAVKVMAATIVETEKSRFDDVVIHAARSPEIEESVADALRELSDNGHIDAVLSATMLVSWAPKLLMARAEVPLFLAAENETKMRQMNLHWGVRPFLMKTIKRETFVARATAELKKKRWVNKGMRVAVVLGGEHGAGFDVVTI